MNENELLEKEELRNKLVDRYDILEKVRELLLIPSTEFATTQQVADFYEVEKKTIEKVVERNNDELVNDGMITLTGKEAKEKLGKYNVKIINKRGYFELNGVKMSNRANTLFPRKAILKVGLLLQDSVIADKIKQEMGFPTSLKINGSREEIKFFDKLEEMFAVMNIQKGIKQYNVLGKYRIDYYMPEFRLAIEYDENGHSGYTYEQHEGRQKEIQKELCCDFVRLDNRDDIFINIAKVFKGIIDYKNDALEFADDFIKYYSA